MSLLHTPCPHSVLGPTGWCSPNPSLTISSLLQCQCHILLEPSISFWTRAGYCCHPETFYFWNPKFQNSTLRTKTPTCTACAGWNKATAATPIRRWNLFPFLELMLSFWLLGPKACSGGDAVWGLESRSPETLQFYLLAVGMLPQARHVRKLA